MSTGNIIANARQLGNTYINMYEYEVKIEALSKTYEELVKTVTENAAYIKYIDNTSEELQLIAMRQQPYVIMYIKKPCYEAQLMAIYSNKNLINCISDLHPDIQLLAMMM
jgi:hypothetical protein